MTHTLKYNVISWKRKKKKYPHDFNIVCLYINNREIHITLHTHVYLIIAWKDFKFSVVDIA